MLILVYENEDGNMTLYRTENAPKALKTIIGEEWSWKKWWESHDEYDTDIEPIDGYIRHCGDCDFNLTLNKDDERVIRIFYDFEGTKPYTGYYMVAGGGYHGYGYITLEVKNVYEDDKNKMIQKIINEYREECEYEFEDADELFSYINNDMKIPKTIDDWDPRYNFTTCCSDCHNYTNFIPIEKVHEL